MQRSPALLDTSFLVRYLTNDPPAMAARAAEILDSDEPLVLSEMALLESAYVLSTVYGVARPDVVDALAALVQKSNLRLVALPKERVLEALWLCRDSKRHSFVDAFLWAQAREMQVDCIYSFDRRFPAEGVRVVGLK